MNNTLSYDELCKQINDEYKKILDPSIDATQAISKKLGVDKSIVREALGDKDYYDFIDKIND